MGEGAGFCDREWIAAIVEEHQGAIRSYMARLAPDPVSADDLAQEVFLAALQSLKGVEPALGMRAYLIGIARNLARAAWRRRYQSREVAGEKVFDVLCARQPDSPADRDAEPRLAALHECLRRLAPKALRVVERHYHDELRCDEIAAEMGLKTSSIRTVLTRARQALRDCVQARLGGASG